MKRASRRLTSVLALALGTSVSALPRAFAASLPANNDVNLQAEILNKVLNKPNLKGVKVSAHGRVITLTGTVPLFAMKQEADRRTHKIKGGASRFKRDPGCRFESFGLSGGGEAGQSDFIRPHRIRHDAL